VAPEFVSNEEIVQAARRNIGQGEYDYLVGGSESETTLRRNRLAFDGYAFRPRVLRDVSKINTSTSFMGHHLRIPVLLAPIGSLQAFTPTGGVASAQAAAEFGVVHVVSTATEPSLEEIAASTDAPKIFQLYVRGDDDWVRDILMRAKNAGYKSIAVTVDLAVDSRRERPMISRYTRLSRRIPFDRVHQARLTWEKLDWIKEITGMPILLKGVQTPEDAELAVQHGVDVIWVSNHGGRQLDHAEGSLDVLAQVMPVVGDKADVIVDGGVQRGSDVLKAIALGAKCVAIGRLQGWGLAAAGKDGVVRVLEILENEIISAMGLLGVTSIDQLGPEYLTRAPMVTPPHEMSSWVNMPVGRIQ
jgi:isopentenyl diphosphate isomerase/L-lactate dehydrogenase-like FMN-dependent dehydrogenase